MQNRPLVVRAGALIDGESTIARKNVSLVIDGGRLVSIEPGHSFEVPAGAEVIDASGMVVMPGLVDLHVHLGAPNVVSTSHPHVGHLSRSHSEILLAAAGHAQAMLAAGFTTIRDLDLPTPSGPVAESIVSLKEAFAKGTLLGPRLIVGGMAHITASHFDLAMPRNLPRNPEWTADGPWDFRRLVRQNVRNGVDCIKTCISGGLGTFCEESIWSRNITAEELRAMVDEAHAFGKSTAAHCHTPDSIRMALEADVDTIEHCVFTDQDSIARVVAAGKYVVPTLAFRQQRTIDRKRERGVSAMVLEQMGEMRDAANRSFRDYVSAGAKIAMGTDTNVDPPFGENAYELEVYVNLGMSPMEAIQTATRNAMEAIGLDKELGTLAPGRIADLILVDGDPLKDISILGDRSRIKLVMRNGQVHVDRRDSSRNAGANAARDGWTIQ